MSTSIIFGHTFSNTRQSTDQNVDFSTKNLLLTLQLGLIGSIATILIGLYLYFFPTPRFGFVYTMIVIGSGVGAFVGVCLSRWLLYKGRPKQAVYVILYFILTLQLVALIFSQEGFYDPYIFAPSFIMILAGYYISDRLMWMVVNVSVATVALVFFLETLGIKTTPHPEPAFFQLFLYVAYMYAFRWFLGNSLVRLRQQAAELRKSRDQLANHQIVLEKEVASRTEDLARLLQEKDAFLTMLTHDMKTPLTSIGLYAEMLTRQPEIAMSKPNVIQGIMRSNKTLHNMVNNLVDIERLATDGTLPLDRHPFVFADLAKSAVDEHLPLAVNKRIGLEITIADGVEEIEVFGDKSQLARAMHNLIGNAIKYSPEQRPVAVFVNKGKDQKIRFSVKDNGYGIPAEDLPRIFDRYWRVEKHKHKAIGSGLGLAIVKGIVEAHDARTSAESYEGYGSTFSFELPVLRQNSY